MDRLIIQIYEIQSPRDVEWLVELGVDHIGSVLVSESDYKNAGVKETVAEVAALGAVSSLIPLFNTAGNVYRALDFHGPDIVHFCEDVSPGKEGADRVKRLVALQRGVRERFPTKIMRSIPLGRPGAQTAHDFLELAGLFAPVSDFFLTDTLLAGPANTESDQPVSGFVGITGQTCDWDAAVALKEKGGLPVILAGGLSPENVGQAVGRVGPAGVDSCTRTNARDNKGRPIRFVKDRDLVAAFVENARAAQETIKTNSSKQDK